MYSSEYCDYASKNWFIYLNKTNSTEQKMNTKEITETFTEMDWWITNRIKKIGTEKLNTKELKK